MQALASLAQAWQGVNRFMTERSVTLEAVADLAGVHAATVSRVVNRPEVVKPETRARVERAIADLDYRPNRAARVLAGGATGVVAVLVPDLTNPYFSSVVKAAQNGLEDTGSIVAVADTGRSGSQELRLVDRLAPDADGFIICSPISGGRDLLAAAGGRRMVSVNRRFEDLASVAVDQAAIVEGGVRHLRELGHELILSVSGPDAYWSTARRAEAERRLEYPPQRIGPFAPTFAGGFEAAPTVAASGATALLAFNDAQALGLIAGLADIGLSVPADISIVGSDDVPFAAMANPALTTMAAPLGRLGLTAVELLAAGSTAAMSLGVELRVRASTGRPR